MIGINPDYDYLYDPQQAKVYGFCEKCGSEIYCTGKELCFKCEEEQTHGNEE